MTPALHRNGLGLLVLTMASAAASGSLVAQVNWSAELTPYNGHGPYCYDRDRGVMVFVGRGDTYEHTAGSGWSFRASGFQGEPGFIFGGIAYDATRRRVVSHDGVRTWHWNGSSWTLAASVPTWSFLHVVAHEGRGTVMAFGGPNHWDGNDLYEWNGSTWSLIPATVKPPRPGDWMSSMRYAACTYDPRRDKLVLYGGVWYDWTRSTVLFTQPDLWEWDATNGWVNRTVQGGFVDGVASVYFDRQRGVVGLLSSYPAAPRAAEWDGGGSWQALTPINAPARASLITQPHAAYHPGVGRFFLGLTDSWGHVAYSFGSQNPAAFDNVGPGCAGMLGAPNLILTKDWTRAWMGRTLSVDLKNLPLSTGFLAIGWSDQQAGSFQLPLDLAPFGMPGCHARVATDLIVPLTGANNTATWTTPVPQNNALLGVSFYLQGFAIDPAANAAGLTASNSVRVTIGRL